MHIFINGDWVPHEKAMISVRDIGVLRGFAIFDYLRTYGKKPFRLQDHIDRFFNSARLLGMTPNYSQKEIKDIITQGIEKNGFKDTNIKFIQTGGISADGFLPAEDQTFFAYFYEGGDLPKEFYESGIKVITSSLMRQLPEAKTINYAASIIEVQRANKQGAADILHTDSEGNIYEATRSNFFGVKDGRLITADTGILLGITRKVVLEIAKQLGIEVEYRFLNTSELADLDEAFVTNSSQEVLPVVEIDGKPVGSGKSGEMCQKLLKEYRAHIS